MYKSKRFIEIDFMRGITIIMMVLFHILYDLTIFHNFPIDIFNGFWFYFGKITAIIFLLLVGISISLKSRTKSFNYYFKRALSIIIFALLITIFTFIFFKNEYIIFGILHLIGLSILIIYPFTKLNNIVLSILSLFIIIIGITISNYYYNFNYLLFLGFKNIGFNSIDYYPLFPWFSIILIGLIVGRKLYKNNQRNFKLIEIDNKIINKISYIGKYSLLIYLIHQPIIFLVLKFLV